MEKSMNTGTEKWRNCPMCKGLGFHEGKICVCITGKDELDSLKRLFSTFDEKKDRGSGK